MAKDKEYDDLSQYIVNTLFENWKKNREPLERRWNQNLAAMRRELDTDWKQNPEEGKRPWQSTMHTGWLRQKVTYALCLILDMAMRGGNIRFALELDPKVKPQQDEWPAEWRDAVEKAKEQMEGLIAQQLSDGRAMFALENNVLSMLTYGLTYGRAGVDVVQDNLWLPDMGLGGGISSGQGIGYDSLSWRRETNRNTIPAWHFASTWEIYRDMEELSGDMREGAGFIHFKPVSAYWLRQRKGRPFFLDDQIEDVLTAYEDDDGSDISKMEQSLPPGLRGIKSRQRKIPTYELRGRVPRKSVTEWIESYKSERNLSDNDITQRLPRFPEYKDDGDEVEVITMVAGTKVIRHIFSTPEQRKLHMAVWDQNVDEAGGWGIADNALPAQKLIDGAIQTIENTNKLASCLILAYKESAFQNAEDIPDGIRQGFLRLLMEDGMYENIQQAMHQFQFQPVGERLWPLLQHAERLGDDDSMVPKISQGIQRPEDGDETAYAASQRLEKAGKYFGKGMRNLDAMLTEPMIQEFYEANMRDPSITAAKGPFACKALGYSSWQNHIDRVNALMRLLELIRETESTRDYRITDIIDEAARSENIDPDLYKYSPKEKQQMQQQEQQSQQAQLEIQERMAEIEKDRASAALDQQKALSEEHEREISEAKVELEAEKTEANLASKTVEP